MQDNLIEKVTVVLPARNCAKRLDRCLRILTAGTAGENGLRVHSRDTGAAQNGSGVHSRDTGAAQNGKENGTDRGPALIVVDDGSSDGTVQMVRRKYPAVTLLTLPVHTGYAHAANAGLRLVRTEYAFLLRPDQLQPGKKCLARLLQAMETGRKCRPGIWRAMRSGADSDAENGVFCAIPVRTVEKTQGTPAPCEGILTPGVCGKSRLREDRVLCPQGSREPGVCGKSRLREDRVLCPQGSRKPGVSGKNRPQGEKYKKVTKRTVPFIRKNRLQGRERAPVYAKGGETASVPAQGEGQFRKLSETAAVPDGCALYRMRALEEIGWFDERHFDGLEALDLSLRASLYGWTTLQVNGAAVRPWEKDAGTDTFRRQLAAGNAPFVFYKNLPGLQRLLGFPLFAAADAAQTVAFLKEGQAGACRMARIRGRALRSLEKERRAALRDGVSVYPENIADASFLGMDDAVRRIYPLFLAQKEPFLFSRIPRYLHLQRLLAAALLHAKHT